MASKKLGTLIKAARTNAGLTQEQLAKKVTGMSASQVSKAERGELTPTQEQLKAIAKATGVTQKSLLDAVGKKTSSASGSSGSMKLTDTEKKLVTLYREADSSTKKKVMNILKGETNAGSEIIETLLEGALGQIGKK